MSLRAIDAAERYCCYPIRHPEIWRMYKLMMASFWTVEEVDLSHDVQDWQKLTLPERKYLTHVLSFFAFSDGVVGENIIENFQREITIPEARFVYGCQNFFEQIHSEMYSLLIDTYIEPQEKQRCFRSCLESPALSAKLQWCQQYMNSELPLAERLVAFAVVEGLMFSSSFAAIYYFKKRGLLPGLTFSNELISRDEAMHTEFAVMLYRYYCESLPSASIRSIVQDGVRVEQAFVREGMQDILGLSVATMCRYVEFVADYLLTMLECEKLYNVDNPLEFMELISLQGKTNFFEKRVGEYQKAGVATGASHELSFDDNDF
jgi:ribonucleoside-diphosphate reductase beta chain